MVMGAVVAEPSGSRVIVSRYVVGCSASRTALPCRLRSRTLSRAAAMPPGAAATTTSLLTGAVLVGLGLLVAVLVGLLVGLGGLVGVGVGALVVVGAVTTTENPAVSRPTGLPVASCRRTTSLWAPAPRARTSSGFAVPSGFVPARSYGAALSVVVRALLVPGSSSKTTRVTPPAAGTKTYELADRVAPSRGLAAVR